MHLFCKVPAGADREAVAAAVEAAQAADVQVVTFAVLGHKADVGFMALGDDLWKLRDLQSALQAAGLGVVDSFVSVTEVSEYAQHLTEGMKRPRLYPQLPPDDKYAICFYPMSKRRNVEQNWYALPYEEREALMQGHGKVGRTFSGRVVQLITASTGIDDWEWGVTLFAAHPDDLKDVVYTMRFDEASATYAEFGPFVTGMIAGVDEVMSRL
ncbi:MAG: chlorite dismutase family protein [Actinobacteria bacterium]|nr:chlorite dismutase family protein [Actinomycetota bacterium]MBV9935724.1 chlorite dismutase family protein [Actinomycetota bacterium]